MIDSLLTFFQNMPGQVGLWGVVAVLIICGLGLPLPEEIPLFVAGFLAHDGSVSLAQAVILPTAAIVIGDSILFSFGYRYGHQIFKTKIVAKFLTPDMLKKVNDYFHRYGNRVVFVARFLAGLRAPVFLMAGVLRMPYQRFLLLDGIAACISAPLIVWVTYHFFNYFDGQTDKVLEMVRRTEKMLVVGVILGVIALSIYLYKRQKNKKISQD